MKLRPEEDFRRKARRRIAQIVELHGDQPATAQTNVGDSSCTGQALSSDKLTGGAVDRVGNRIRKTFSIAEARVAMGIDWMPMSSLSQAVPPAYAEFIGRQALEVLTRESTRRRA